MNAILKELKDAVREVVQEEVPKLLRLQPERDYLDAEGARVMLGFKNRKTVERLARAGTLPATRAGREWRFFKADLVAYLEQGANKAKRGKGAAK